METLLSDHARRLGELSTFNVKSCDSSRYPRGPHPGKADDRCITCALGSVTKEFDRWIEKLRMPGDVGVIQKTAMLGTSRILWKVFEM